MDDVMTAKEPSKAKSAILMLICSFTGTKLKLKVKSVLGSRRFAIALFHQAFESTGFLFPKLVDIPASYSDPHFQLWQEERAFALDPLQSSCTVVANNIAIFGLKFLFSSTVSCK